jgi:hypothetical protein
MAGRTVNPDQITDLTSWCTYSKKGYKNVVQRHRDGALVVLTPGTTDVENAVKEFYPAKAIDAIAYLNAPETNAELRVQAGTRMETLTRERAVKIAAANTAFRQQETALLAKVREWKVTEDEGIKQLIVGEIGHMQKELEALDLARRQVQYPNRFITTTMLQKNVADPTSQNPKLLPFPVYQAKVPSTVSSDRVIAMGTV